MFWLTSGLFAAATTFKLAWLDRLAARGMYCCTPENCADYSKIFPKVKHCPDPARRKREGQPPSEWLRSLTSSELRAWLKTLDYSKMPVALVEGMTATFHLTEHHSFKASHIRGLTHKELIQLHSAAHYGY